MLGRQHERLAELVGRLVDREAGGERGDLEQHAVRLAEVDRAEVRAVDDRRRLRAALARGVAPGGVVLVARGPGDVVDGAGPLQAALGGRGIVRVRRAALLAGEHGVRVEAEPVEQRPRAVGVERVRAHAVEALQRMLGRDAGRLGDQRRVGHVGLGDLDPDSLRIARAQPAVGPLHRPPGVLEAGGPEVQRGVARDPPGDGVDHARAVAAGHRSGELEERHDRAGRAVLVAVVEVVDVRCVVVDGLLDESQAERAGVEVHVARCVGGDRGDVVESFEAHFPHRSRRLRVQPPCR